MPVQTQPATCIHKKDPPIGGSFTFPASLPTLTAILLFLVFLFLFFFLFLLFFLQFLF